MESHSSFETLMDLSRRTGLPESWLKSEALSGRLPFIKVIECLFGNLIVYLNIAESCSNVIVTS